MRKIFNNRYVEVVVAIILCLFLFVLVGQNLLGDILMQLTLYKLDGDTWQFLGMYTSFIGVWIIVIAYMLLTKKNRPMLQLLGRKPSGNRVGTALIWGLSCGFGINMICALVSIATGDIHLTFNKFNLGLFLLFLCAVLIQSSAEELCDRLFLFQRIKKAFPHKVEVAVILNSLLFAACHLMNQGITVLALISLFVTGVMFTAMIVYLDSFWAPVVAHTSWNFCQSILLGLPNSGIVSAYSVFKLDAASASDGIAYTTNFGIESSPLMIILIIAATIVIYLYGTKIRKKECLNIWKES